MKGLRVTSDVRRFLRSLPMVRPLRLARLRHIANTLGHEDWAALLGSDLALFDRLRSHAEAGSGPRVLIATGLGGHFGVNVIDRLLAVALTRRGAAISIALCDGILGACQMCEANLFPDQGRFLRHGPTRDLCGYCFAPAAAAYAPLGLPVHMWGSLIDADDAAAAAAAAAAPTDHLEAYCWNDIPVGEHAKAGVLRFFARGDLAQEALGEAALRRYVRAAVLTAIATDRLLDRLRPDVVVAHHGIYVPQGLVAEVARRRGVRLVTWNPAYRRHCFLFSHDASYHYTMMDEPMAAWRDRPLAPAERACITRYLRSRWEGGNDWIRFQRDPDYALTQDLRALGLDPDKPVVIALTNVFWDAQLHYPTNAFASQKDWLIGTVAWFARHPALQLVVRVHPAELSGTPASRQFAATELAAAFPRLPGNVTVIPPDSPASTYALAQRCDCALIYATKTGVELSCMGIPVIVAGEAWVRNKDITFDATSQSHYFDLLARLPFGARLSPETVERAHRYAFHFFFRRMVPLPFVEPVDGPRRYATRIAGLEDLAPGRWPGLDVICDGILQGAPFHMPEDAALRNGAP